MKGKMKGKFSFLLIMILILVQIPSIGLARDDEGEKIDTTKLMPLLNVSNSDIPKGQAGDSISLNLNIKNKSPYTARNVIITPEFIGEDNPFSLDNLNFTQTLDKIDAKGSANISLKLAISPDAKEKNYPIKLNYQYTNGWNDPGSSSEIIYVKVINKNVPPRLVISKVNVSPQPIKAGDEVTVGLTVENQGSLDAKDIRFTLDGLTGEGFIISSGTNSQYQKKLSGGGVGYIVFKLKSSKNIPRGNHGLDLKMTYKDTLGQSYEDTQKFFLSLDNNSKGSNIVIENILYPSDTIRPGKDFTIGFDVKNLGDTIANNVKVSVESSDPAIIPKTASIKKLNTLEAGKSANFTFVLSPTAEATTKNYPINITVEYEDELNAGKEKSVVTQYVGVYVEKIDKGEGANKGKPKLIIDQYSFEPALAKAGENFTMNLSFFNTNAKKTVKNIKISLVVDEKTEETGNVFTPVGSSNTFYIDSIPPKGRVGKTITMFTVPDAKAKSYNITANFEYEDTEGQEYTATELIGVPVVQQSKLEIGEISIPTENYVGQPIPVMVEFYNMGKVTLYNTMVSLEGDFQTENGNYYVGNFESGNSETFEGTIIPDSPGEIKGTLVFSYDDTSGEHVEIRKDFKLNVEEAPPMDEFPDDMNPDMNQSKGILKSKKFWIILAIIVGGGIGGIKFYKNRKKKKEGMALDE